VAHGCGIAVGWDLSDNGKLSVKAKFIGNAVI
jgi:hypothetical protein